MIILYALAVIVVSVLMFTGLVWFGFRMGRTVVGYTPEPIVKAKEEALVDEDPYFLPMHGFEQGNQPTVEDRI